MIESAGRELRDRLVRLFGAPDATLDDAAFDALARQVFAFQLEYNPPYAAYCRRRGADASTLEHWSEIPAAPAAAFREIALVAGDATQCDAVFRTSGTTLRRSRRGTHYVPDLALYHASLLPNFRRHLLADGATLPMLSLVPPAHELTESSLAHMIDTVMLAFADGGGAWFASVARGVHVAELNAALEVLEHERRPVCLLGTSLSFAHWMDAIAAERRRFRLPPGSRLMDTGGYKGRRRVVPEGQLREVYHEQLGLDPDFCVNEYGMTELCSQYYDDTLRERPRGRGAEALGTAGPTASGEPAAPVRGIAAAVPIGAARPRRKVGPPWLRARVVDPETLRPVAAGEPGLLRHFDLANLGSVIAVQTEDLGQEIDGGFVVLGRAAGASPRGCSIALDELISAASEGGR